MTEETGFIAGESARELSALSTQVFTAVASIMEYMRESLPEERKEQMFMALQSGGAIGIEATVDHKGSRTLKLVCARAGEATQAVASVLFIGDPPRTESKR